VATTKQQPDPAWTDDDLSENPHVAADKATRVQKMFSAIAPSYDLNNRLHSMWQDQAWRRKAVRLCGAGVDKFVLDIACGTGDLSLAFHAGGAGSVVGLDFTHEMVAIATHKATSAGKPVCFADGDAQRLPVGDEAADVVSIAFGIRNVAKPAAAVAEFHRVLRPGGTVCILEFSLPSNRLMRGLYNFYFRHIMPRTATLISRDRSGAYKYLPRSVNTFLGRGEMVEMLRGAGFTDVTLHPMTFGIAVAYIARKAGA